MQTPNPSPAENGAKALTTPESQIENPPPGKCSLAFGPSSPEEKDPRVSPLQIT